MAAELDVGLLAHLSLADAKEYGRIAARHDLLTRRWLRYEVDPQLQFDFPAMSDPAFPPTAAMINATRAARPERTAGNPADYKLAVAVFPGPGSSGAGGRRSLEEARGQATGRSCGLPPRRLTATHGSHKTQRDSASYK